ncbi:hypothetical protein DLAC_11023 [Tieghemostelium lacteum]|uniref:Uncharacterized protein n=1 Tax=Tieghemostelium lacteum TaxID=361077 RepID=A0A151Z3C5_TIELA|nr:hypothetical protein DLAC_11023 [Tieghemostelium lacteum]|eukprot:KYQ88324.1 hypothetical protein DLAC_11023 [Tieghemostelium lacteum]
MIFYKIKKIWRSIWKHESARQIVIFLQVLLLAYLMSKAVIKFQMLDNKTTISEFSNRYCSSTSPNQENCKKIGYGYQRLLFFYNDGLARDLSDDLVKMLAGHSNTFRIQNEGFPASYAVFTSYVTGTPPTNYMGAPILNDNIIYQLTSNNIPMRYYGTRMPAYDVLEDGKYFNKVGLEYVQNHKSFLYKSLFECNATKDHREDCANQFLDDQKSEGQSIFFSADVVDERNHVTGDKHDELTLEIIKKWIEDMKYVKDWVDNNPEYLLVIISDHGGKLKSETAAHGDNNNGNEAFMVIYSPDLAPLPEDLQDKFIDQVDVCSTIWQHFAGSGVSLPAENIGKIYPTSTNKERIYYTLLANAQQLLEFGQLWSYKTNTKLFKEAQDLHQSDIDESINLFTNYINSLKIPFLNLKRFPWKEVIMYPIVISLLIISLLSKQYGSLGSLSRECKGPKFFLVFIPYLVIFGITGLFSGFWVLYWHDDNESIHMFVASLLATLAMHFSSTATEIYVDSSKKVQEEQEMTVVDENSRERANLDATHSHDYKKPNNWIIMYSFFSFFFAVTIYLLVIPLEDLLLVKLYHRSYLIAAIALLVEFVHQKRRIQSHLVINCRHLSWKSGVYMPLYCRTVLYYIMLYCVYYYDYSWQVDKIMKSSVAFFIYSVLGVHSVILLFNSKHVQADLYLPFSMALFFLSNDRERFYLLLFVLPQFYSISSVFYYKLYNTFQPVLTRYRKLATGQSPWTSKEIYRYSLKDQNFFLGMTDHFLPVVVLLITAIALSCFKMMKMNFQIGDVAIYVPGVYDPPTTPVFSGFVMGFHKLGYFFLLGAFLIKLGSPCPPALVPRYLKNSDQWMFGYKSKSNKDFERIVESLNTQIWGFLMLLLLCSMFFFHLGYYNFMIIKSFVFTVTISVIVLFYGATMVTSFIGKRIQNLFRRFIYNHHFSSKKDYKKLNTQW